MLSSVAATNRYFSALLPGLGFFGLTRSGVSQDVALGHVVTMHWNHQDAWVESSTLPGKAHPRHPHVGKRTK